MREALSIDLSAFERDTDDTRVRRRSRGFDGSPPPGHGLANLAERIDRARGRDYSVISRPGTRHDGPRRSRTSWKRDDTAHEPCSEVVIAEDHYLVRAGLRRVLEEIRRDPHRRHRRQLRRAVAIVARSASNPMSCSPTSACRPTTTPKASTPHCSCGANAPDLGVVVISQYVGRGLHHRAPPRRHQRHRLPAEGTHRRPRPTHRRRPHRRRRAGPSSTATWSPPSSKPPHAAATHHFTSPLGPRARRAPLHGPEE